MESSIKILMILAFALLLKGCVGCPRTDRYYSSLKEMQTDSLMPNLSIFSAVPYKEVRYTARVNSLNQKPDSIILATKFRKYNLKLKDSIVKDNYTEYLYVKGIRIGDINWYSRNNAQEISLESYKDNSLVNVVYYRAKEQ
jgi:PBP1b-binding outer membrane lipoprotein LpoB